ncbi:MAG: aminotransferase class V-fold PLP-dependent enzyme [Oscillospiraceae bacterium]|nr:aminotransferase class V-fold PLP-dependent enzyme [Oscillospiraceae bacterium]
MVYFDNAATTFPKPEEVYKFTDKFYRECGVNVGRGQHKLSSKASFLVAETRKLLLELNYCPSKKVVFTSTATEALNIVLQGIEIKDNFNIYITPFEHNAVTRILHHLNKTIKFNVKQLEFDKDIWQYDIPKIEKQFQDNAPDIVIISHASNVCGVIAPVKKVTQISKKYNAINIIDMAQTMGLLDTNLNGNDIDFAVFAGHKTLYSPIGVGGFICNENPKIKPLIFGGTGFESANFDLPETIPERFEAGSQNIMAIAGLNASLKWINSIKISKIYQIEKKHHSRLLDILKKFNNIKLISPTNALNSIGVVSCVFDNYSSDNIGQVLSDNDIAVRTGLHCSPNAHKFLETFPQGTVRFSVGYFNNDYDFEMLEKALEYIYENG